MMSVTGAYFLSRRVSASMNFPRALTLTPQVQDCPLQDAQENVSAASGPRSSSSDSLVQPHVASAGSPAGAGTPAASHVASAGSSAAGSVVQASKPQGW